MLPERFAVGLTPLPTAARAARQRSALRMRIISAVISLALLAFHVWPWRRPVGKIADRLEAEGQPTPLRSAFGYADNAGAVQRL